MWLYSCGAAVWSLRPFALPAVEAPAHSREVLKMSPNVPECPRRVAAPMATRCGHTACFPERRLCALGRRGVAVVSRLGFRVHSVGAVRTTFTIILAMISPFRIGFLVSSGLLACSVKSFYTDRNSFLRPSFLISFKLAAVEPRGPCACSRGGLFWTLSCQLISLVSKEKNH